MVGVGPRFYGRGAFVCFGWEAFATSVRLSLECALTRAHYGARQMLPVLLLRGPLVRRGRHAPWAGLAPDAGGRPGAPRQHGRRTGPRPERTAARGPRHTGSASGQKRRPPARSEVLASGEAWIHEGGIRLDGNSGPECAGIRVVWREEKKGRSHATRPLWPRDVRASLRGVGTYAPSSVHVAAVAKLLSLNFGCDVRRLRLGQGAALSPDQKCARGTLVPM